MQRRGKEATLCSMMALLLVSATCAAGGSATRLPAPPDYSHASSWICRPGAEEVCTTGLDVAVLRPDGTQQVQVFQPAAAPPIDCFYVYPTVSDESQYYADLTLSPAIRQVTKQQAGRLSSRCRVFAPLYRQLTPAHLRRDANGSERDKWKLPAEDVAEALRYYLEHDNQGRGVVLIGHSQGSILLQVVLAADVDGKRAQSLLVSAFLAGDLSLGVPRGRPVGGTLQHIAVCSSAAQTGCVYVWNSYAKDDPSPTQVFGFPRSDVLVSACASPAAPGGGEGALKSIFPRAPELPKGDTPYVEVDGALDGACRVEASGNGLRVGVERGAQAKAYRRLLDRSAVAPGWGLHVLDVDLVLGNILDVIDAETRTWLASHPRP